MKDFTLTTYMHYLRAIKSAYSNIFSFADFFSLDEFPRSFILIRHDVDRKPENALKMALLENEMGINSTYYFRTRPHVFRPEIIAAIAEKGHEIGYHYESFSDAKGDYEIALADFEKNLKRFREIAEIRTISMHGAPLSPYDNRDLWRSPEYHAHLKESLGILGEVYLDIDYREIAYITDTGRSWRSEKSNRRDTVNSAIRPGFDNTKALLDCLKGSCYSKVIFQVHPERWTDSRIDYFRQAARDWFANSIKTVIRRLS